MSSLPNLPTYSRSRRVRKAYWTTAVVIFSYVRLWIARKFLGQQYYDRHILALHIKNAERVKNAILQLNGLFIKVGQMLSILTNFLPEAFQKPLEALQDQLPARPYEQVRERITQSLGQTPEALFAKFDTTPIATASIGQAHRAQLHDGTQVVVKVQHVGIEDIAKIDLDIIRRLTKLLAWFYNINGMDYLYTQIRRMIEEELDFGQEAESMQIIAKNLESEPKIAIPTVHLAYSTAQVMTTTWFDGIKISQTDQLDAWQIDRTALTETLLRAFCRMIFKDGFYHADPHPGNILVQQNGTLVLLDFGATSHLSQALREGIPKLIEAAIKNDTTTMIEACRAMGFIADGRESEQIARKMITALRNFLQNDIKLDGLDFKNIEVNPLNNSLLSLLQDIGISGISGTVQVPKDYILLNRAVTLLLGLCHTLAPKLNPLDTIRPYVKELLVGNDGNIITFGRKILQNTLTNTLSLPADLHQTLQQIRNGQLITRQPDTADAARLIYLGIRQIILIFLIISAIVIAHKIPEYNQITYAIALLLSWNFVKTWRNGGKLFRRMGQDY